ncbi:MAG: hypothetical protein LBJ25_00805 [Candidatus Margulisbacteria bacterium]|jgi:hypothetical protein|nr:hypothetical protein [Candidatus Margulisiibacteriota bacterium]
MATIQPVIDEMNKETAKEQNQQLIYGCIQSLSLEMPDQQFIVIWQAFANYLTVTAKIGFIDPKDFEAVFDRLILLNRNLLLKIIEQILNIKTHIIHQTFSDGTSWDSLDARDIKLGSAWLYDNILKKAQDLFCHEPLALLNLLVTIYLNIFVGLTEEQINSYEQSGYIRRAAIEIHSQDEYKKHDVTYKLVSAIRDTGLAILNTNQPDYINQMFQLLADKNLPIFKRIILYLLRVEKNYEPQLLIKYLTDYDLFSDHGYLHEYYHLAQDKFGELSQDAQNKILNYIESGPQEEYYQQDSEYWPKPRKINHWIHHRIDPIIKYLPQAFTDKYKDFLFDENGEYKPYNNGEHPDFSSYMTSLHGSVSPKEDSDIAEMPIPKLVEYLKNWKPERTGFDAPTINGLADTLGKAVETQPNKYLQQLELFKAVTEPTYIRKVLFALDNVKDKTMDDWRKIQDLCKLVIQQNKNFPDRKAWLEADPNWHWAKHEAARLISNLYSQSYKDLIIEDGFLTDSFNILKKLVLEQDEHLEKKEVQSDTMRADREFYTSAINSMHGTALEGLIYYAFWLSNNKKTTEHVLPVLDKLLETGTYPETWAVFGRFYPWLNSHFEKWSTANLDKIFVKSAKDKFDAAWLSYLKYAQFFNNIFGLLESVYKYVLENKFSADNISTENRASQHIALAYGRGLIKLDSDLLKFVFDAPDERNELIRFIGVSLASEKENLPADIITRFINLWDLVLDKFKDMKHDNEAMFENFQWWYESGKFDRKWAIKQLHNLVTKRKIKMEGYMLKDALLTDLQNHTRLVFEIVRELSSSRAGLLVPPDNIIVEIMKYIKENTFTKDQALKTDKDTFINEFLRNRPSYDIDWETKLKPYLDM